MKSLNFRHSCEMSIFRLMEEVDQYRYKILLMKCGHDFKNIRFKKINTRKLAGECKICGNIHFTLEAILDETGLPVKYTERIGDNIMINHKITYNKECLTNWLFCQAGDPHEYDIEKDIYAAKIAWYIVNYHRNGLNKDPFNIDDAEI